MAEVILRIKADSGGAVQVLQQTQAQLDKTASSTQGLGNAQRNTAASSRGLTGALGEVKSALATLGVAAVVADIARAGNAFRGFEAALTAVTGSQQAAARELGFVKQVANELGLNVRTLAQDYTRLAAAAKGTALEGKATRDIFEAIAQAGRVFNLSASEVSGALQAVQQIISKGVVSAEELRGQLGERLPGAFQLAARAIGVTTQELGKLLEQGALTAEDLLPALAAELNNATAAGAEFAANSPAAAFERLNNTLDELKATIAEGGLLDTLAEGARVLAATLITTKNAVEALTNGVALAVDSFAAAGVAAKDFALNFSPLTRAYLEFTGEAKSAGQIVDEFGAKLEGAKGSALTGYTEAVTRAADAFFSIFNPAAAAAESAITETDEAAGRAGAGFGKTADEAGKAAKVVAVLSGGYDDCAVALDLLNDEFTRNKDAAEQAAQAQRQAQQQVQGIIDDLEFEARLLQLGNAEREVEIALRYAGAAATEEQRERIRELIGELQREREIEAAAREFEAIWQRAADSVGDALTTALFEGAESGAEAVKDAMQQLARDLVRFWIQQKIVIPLQQQLVGGPGGGGGLFGGGGGSGLGGYLGAAALGFGIGGGGASGIGGALGGLGGRFIGNLGATIATQAVASGAIGSTLGSVLGSAAPIIGTLLGSVIGRALGGLFEDDPRPRLRINSSGQGIGNIGTRGQTALGSLAFNADDLQDTRGTERQLLEAIQQLDQGIADIVGSISGGADQLNEIRDALANWSIDLRNGAITAENVLGSRFSAILATFDEDVQQFVRGAGDLQAQIEALAEFISRPDRLAGILDALEREDMLASMSQAERQAFLLNEQFDAIAAQAAALGATQEQLAQIEGFRASALERLAGAEQEAAEATVLNLEAIEAYARGVQSLQAQLDDLNAGSDFQRELLGIGRAYRENVDALNAAARAAGLNSARTEDLAVAYQLAATQAAQALARITQAGRELAAELYGSALGDIEAQIAAIEAETQRGTSGLQSFGSAVEQVANTLSDSTRLLLGDLSPLKDRQKLEIALQALRRGEVGAEQVLQLGRRLFASGADYNALFEQVLQIQQAAAGAAAGSGGGGGGGSVGAAPAAPGNPALAALYAERDRLLEEQRTLARRGQAFDLAQIVADIAGATGETFADVLANLTGGRATLETFANDLGVGFDQIEDFLEGLQAATYSPFEYAEALGEIFDTFIENLRDLLAPTADALPLAPGGKPVGPGGVPGLEFDNPGLPAPELPPSEPVPVVVTPTPTPTPERPIEREFVERIRALEGVTANLLAVLADTTGRTAEGVGALVEAQRGASLAEAASRPRSQPRMPV